MLPPGTLCTVTDTVCDAAVCWHRDSCDHRKPSGLAVHVWTGQGQGFGDQFSGMRRAFVTASGFQVEKIGSKRALPAEPLAVHSRDGTLSVTLLPDGKKLLSRPELHEQQAKHVREYELRAPSPQVESERARSPGTARASAEA